MARSSDIEEILSRILGGPIALGFVVAAMAGVEWVLATLRWLWRLPVEGLAAVAGIQASVTLSVALFGFLLVFRAPRRWHYFFSAAAGGVAGYALEGYTFFFDGILDHGPFAFAVVAGITWAAMVHVSVFDAGPAAPRFGLRVHLAVLPFLLLAGYGVVVWYIHFPVRLMTDVAGYALVHGAMFRLYLRMGASEPKK